MAIESLSTFDAVLKIDYLPVIQKQLNADVILYNQVKKDRENVEGSQFRFPAHVAWGETTGAIAETGAIPVVVGNEDLRASFGTIKTIYGRFEVSTKVIAATKSDKGSFVRAVDFKMKALTENLKKDLNVMLNGDGTGALARVTAVSAPNFTVADALPLRPGIVINVWSARTGGTQRNADMTITNVNYDTNVVTVSGAMSAVAPGDFVFKNTGRGVNVMGLLGIVDDGTFVNVFQGIDRSASGGDFWKSSVLANAGVARDLTLGLLQAAEDKAYIRGGARPNMLYSNLGQRTRYLELATADRRYVNTMEFDAGFKALEYNGNPWFVDRECVKNTIFYLDKEVLRFFVMKDIGWMQEDGAILSRGPNLTYQATLDAHLEFGTYQPNRHVVVRDLSEPPGY